MNLCHKGCGRPARIRGMCKSHYQAARKYEFNRTRWSRRPSIGTARRLRALIAIGHSQTEIGTLLGIHPSYISKLAEQNREHVNPDTAERVNALYNKLSMTPGKSKRSLRLAQSKGWAPPLAWDEDDIDNPEAHPDRGIHVKPKFMERYRELRDLGYSDFDILRKWQMRPESLLRQLNRYGITPNPELVTIVSEIKHRQVAS